MFTPKLNVVFCGTPEFSLPTLSLLHIHPRVHLMHVISMPDRPAGRGQHIKSPPVIEYAKKHQLAFTQTENINKEENLINNLSGKVDLIIVLAFAQFLGKSWLNLPHLGCFNIHTSLLPRYRGAAPIQYALLNGDTETGVSIQKMVSKMDAGNIVAEKKIPIYSYDHVSSLQNKLQFAAANTLDEFLYQVIEKTWSEKTQEEQYVSFAPEIPKEMGHVHFASEDRNTVLNKLRGLSPWPGVYFFINHKRVKILDLEIPSPASLFTLAPGEISVMHQQLIVGCKDGTLRISELQLEGKSRTTDQQFINGLRGTLSIT